MNNKQYDVVIIDSGVSCSEEEGIRLATDDEGNICTNEDFSDELGHGTAVYNIIKKHNPSAKCYIIKIFDDENDAADETLLLHSLQYVYNNINCKLINMSLGIAVSSNQTEIYDICEKLKAKGVILVAAFDNMESVSYPAAFDNVIGVASSPDCRKTTDVQVVLNNTVNVCAKGDLQRVKWLNPPFIFTRGNSYACAHVTGILSTQYCKDINAALCSLEKNAISRIDYSDNTEAISKPTFPKGHKAIIFPFNKEMHSLLRFPDLSCLDIVDVYDVRQSARVNASTREILYSNSPEYIVKSIDSINWDSFDILVLGHTGELSRMLGDDQLVANLIIQANQRNKYIYSYDDISQIVNAQNLSADLIFYPQIKAENVQHIPFGMLYRPWVPMLGVFGTTSKQGKFTLQLILRDLFMKNGYKVGQIGTEPSAYLFDMDLCFHFGYAANPIINRYDTISFLNSEINNISKKGVDIIISGCQSGTVTYDYGNAKYYTIPQTEFLLGTLPDAVLLCVNSFDEVEYIERTIKYIESCVDCRVIALVVFPMGYDDSIGRSRLVHLSMEKLEKIRLKLSKHLNLPIYVLGDEADMTMLYENVVSYFSYKGGADNAD